MAILPHGGALVNRTVEGDERTHLIEKAKSMEVIHLNSREVSDLEMIASGALSPLEGFMVKEEYSSVLDLMRLPNGLPWTIPITLSLAKADVDRYKEGSDIALYDQADHLLGILHLDEKYRFDKEKEANQILRTTDESHPGVQYLKGIGDTLLGGKITLLNRPHHENFNQYRLNPKETRVLFNVKGWRRIVAFQTRNPIHRAHEYIQKCALEVVDGLLIHPLVGETKEGDIPATVRMHCYEILLKKYYPRTQTRTVLSVFPAAMRYAGPREAIFHALVRKNYGCTHFIVGRDHAGVGKFYGTYDAHYIFDEFHSEEIGITPLFFDYTFFCKSCDGMASSKTCPHDSSEHIFLSGTAVREMLIKGKLPPSEFTRPEVAEILMSAFHKVKDKKNR
ncbi:MAG: sulfate adenylyltransferase [Deltaproteobacteria bacterium DG_8]|nr:MAG: sulfate adenylyltransferase [Deltaproteobacteria bacterium DG_8]